jgi:hypothetical protein
MYTQLEAIWGFARMKKEKQIEIALLALKNK